MKTMIMSLLLGTALLATSGTPGFAGSVNLELKDIFQPLVPTDNPRGDREFGGNGPRITIDVELRPAWEGKAIFAHVRMHAVEMGGDQSTTTGSWAYPVWRQSASNSWCVRRVLGNASHRIQFISMKGDDPIAAQPGGLPRSVVKKEDGGYVQRLHQPRSFVEYVDVMGDTSGDDISTDDNPHGDTSIRYIKLGSINVDAVRPSQCNQ